MREFVDEAGIPDVYNTERIKLLLDTYVDNIDGVVLVLKCNDEVVGVIMGIAQQHMYNPELAVLVEMAWFVTKEHRKTSASIRLFKRFEERGRELGVSRIYMTLRSSLRSVEKLYTRLGYTEEEKTFSKDL